jgi:hypothetical protein
LFFIENVIENICLNALSWPKLKFGCYITFEIIFKALFQCKKKIKKIWIAGFFLTALNATVFSSAKQMTGTKSLLP